MSDTSPVRTERLILRQWRDEDREPFAALNADPEVMEHFPAPMSRADSDRLADLIQERIEATGFGFWAVEVAETGRFIGFTGLSVPSFDAPFMPAVEIGWRLAREDWGQGYATEAARRALTSGLDDLGLAEVVAFTVPANVRSRAVMRRIGMTRDPAGDFDHPRIPKGHPMRRQMLWRVAVPVT